MLRGAVTQSGRVLDAPANNLCLAGVDHYNEIRGISLCEFLPPHLVIYVDVPAEEVQRKLKQSREVREA